MEKFLKKLKFKNKFHKITITLILNMKTKMIKLILKFSFKYFLIMKK
jgi:hypothetical protein